MWSYVYTMHSTDVSVFSCSAFFYYLLVNSQHVAPSSHPAEGAVNALWLLLVHELSVLVQVCLLFKVST